MNTESMGDFIAASVLCGINIGILFHFFAWFMTRGVVWFAEIFEKGRL